MNIPNLPMQILAITDSASANAFFNNEVCQLLITEGNSIADRLRAHFMTSPTGNQPTKSMVYCEKKQVCLTFSLFQLHFIRLS